MSQFLSLVLWLFILYQNEKVGSGCGKRYGYQQFVCMRDFAEFVPVETVIPEKDFDENPGNPCWDKKLGESGSKFMKMNCVQGQWAVLMYHQVDKRFDI